METYNTTLHYDYDDPFTVWNSSFDSMYDYSYLTRFNFDPRPSIQRLLLGLFLTLNVIFILNGILLLLTALSPQCRSMSPSWYLYHLCVIKTLDSFLVLPLKLSGLLGTTCYAITAMNALFDILQSISIIFINVEVVYTVISPRSYLKRCAKKRFIIANIISWIVGIAFVVTGTMLSARFAPRRYCFYMNTVFEIFRIASCHWLIGLASIIFSVIAFVHYRKARSSGVVYDPFIDDSGTAIKPKEWLICLLTIDCIYVFGLVALNHVLPFIHVHDNVFIYDISFTVFSASLIWPMYSLSSVRSSIRNGFVCFVGMLRKRRKSESRARMTSPEQVVLEACSMDDNEL